MSLSSVSPSWLTTISSMEQGAAVRFLQETGQNTYANVALLADAALTRVEVDVDVADRWLAVGQSLVTEMAPAVPSAVEPIGMRASAQLAYARARLAVHRGQLPVAEVALRQAQAAWQQARDEDGNARSYLGLTQILAMQGRYAEAEDAAQRAIVLLAAAAEGSAFVAKLQLAKAQHNLATLYLYTEQHRRALALYQEVRALLTGIEQSTLHDVEMKQLIAELAHNELNRASALTFLDQPSAAEHALQQANMYFEGLDDLVHRGRVQTNLGRLYLRTGRYAAALAAFEQATDDLIGETAAETSVPLEQLRQADELLLEHAMAYLVMNLLPEAEQALARSEALFRSAQQPYELGQTLYTWGLLRLRSSEWATAQPLLSEAKDRFAALQNEFWLNRTKLAQSALAYRQREHTQALTLLDELVADAGAKPIGVAEESEDEAATEASSQSLLRWDLAGLAELHLLRLRIQIEVADFAGAEQSAQAVAALLGLDLAHVRQRLTDAPAITLALTAQVTGPLPHYALRLHHLLGRLAQATDDVEMAQTHFQQALAILEQQRATLPVEEIRTAFLDDKSEIYVDLIQLLLELSADNPTLIALVFATVERARSRALLERLLTATSATATARESGQTDPEQTATEHIGTEHIASADNQAALEELRQRLHWLYNQLLGESGSRNLSPRLSEQLLKEEARLRRLEWRHSTLLQQADPVDLQTFQATLAPDQQAIVYTILGAGPEAEIIAFLVDCGSITLFRQLTTTTALQSDLDELRFQLGRAELGKAYVERHADRLHARLQPVLERLYQQLLSPLRSALTAGRLLIVPAGPLHRLPFHALWDGTAHLVANYECSYAPSASVVVMRHEHRARAWASTLAARRWAGLAVDDQAIPAARAEVTQAARYFAEPHLYLDGAAGRQGLKCAAQADILHLATHGLFRPDNPFFSALKLADGWIDVRELYRLPLRAQLVVLSACESGAGQIRGGDEVVGLARGFLGAGASEILASLWNVHDESAVDLMDSFYYYLIEETKARPAAALRAAQLDAIAQQQHPYYWAPFFVIGE